MEFICPIAAGAGPVQAVAHLALLAVALGGGSIHVAFAVRAYRRTAPRPPIRRGPATDQAVRPVGVD